MCPAAAAAAAAGGGAPVTRVYAQNLVRTDSREQKLDAFLVTTTAASSRTCDTQSASTGLNRSSTDQNLPSAGLNRSSASLNRSAADQDRLLTCPSMSETDDGEKFPIDLMDFEPSSSMAGGQSERDIKSSAIGCDGYQYLEPSSAANKPLMEAGGKSGATETSSQRREIKLTSVLQLQRDVEADMHSGNLLVYAQFIVLNIVSRL